MEIELKMGDAQKQDFEVKPYAVVETGGKQYRVSSGDRLKVEKIDADEGQDIQISPVLAISDGASLEVGNPEVSNAKVSAKVLEHARGDKVVNFKKKRRKGYTRKKGHRQELTVLEIGEIGQA
jgi:large subunit ribosomal protein L21